VAILSRAGIAPTRRTRGLTADPADSHSRYIEADMGGIVIASLYAPNGNPLGTAKFDYKLRWIERLRLHAQELLAGGKCEPIRRRCPTGESNQYSRCRHAFRVSQFPNFPIFRFPSFPLFRFSALHAFTRVRLPVFAAS